VVKNYLVTGPLIYLNFKIMQKDGCQVITNNACLPRKIFPNVTSFLVTMGQLDGILYYLKS
jgi:hypothetical protein